MGRETSACVEAAVVSVDAIFESRPFGPRLSAIHEEMRAGFVAGLHARASPVVMRHDVTQRDAMLPHEIGGETSRAIQDGIEADTRILTHLDADGGPVSRPIEIGMSALNGGGEVLDGVTAIHREVPREPSRARSTRTADRAQTMSHGHGVFAGLHPGITCGMNGDVVGIHGGMLFPLQRRWRDKARAHTDFGKHLTR